METVSTPVAWKLLDSLFLQTTSLVLGGVVFFSLGLIGFAGTGSGWYLIASAAAGLICSLRLWQAGHYAAARSNNTPRVLATRAAIGCWITAATWGGWSTVLVFETERTFVLMVIGAQAACMVSAAVRNCAVRRIADVQVFLTLGPLFVCCLACPNVYLRFYAPFVGMYILVGLSLAKFLNRQTLKLLLQDEEKTDLVARLEAAKQELEVINAHLQTLVSTDALTRVANRRAFDLAIAMEWRRGLREAAPLSLLLLDVDHFKSYNDEYGHPAGDACLRDLAHAITAAVQRPGDVVARYGGEEFSVILPATSLEDAVTVAERIRAAVVQCGIPHVGNPAGIVTVSIGIACRVPDREPGVEGLISLADEQLYAAKHANRNCVRAVRGTDLARSSTAGKPAVESVA